MSTAAPIPDWGAGRYETTALHLLPAAEAVVHSAAVRPGERVLDLGCGTGNAAVLAAERGAVVTGVDPSARLLGVARARAAEQGAGAATFVLGRAESIPLADAVADAVVSVFAVIFCADPQAAAAEMCRVVADRGRIVFSAWLPEGAIARMGAMVGEGVAHVLGTPPPRPRFPWHDPDALTALFAPHGFGVAVEEHTLSFVGASARDYYTRESRDHPMAVGARQVLERAGRFEELTERIVAMLEEANEDRDGFRVTSRYRVVTVRRK